MVIKQQRIILYVTDKINFFRYKMISQYTWPNFRGGSDKDGVRTLMDEKGFSQDIKYGHTKIFIRSPQTLFALEKVKQSSITV